MSCKTVDYYKELGRNIREIRNLRNLSLPEVSQIIVDKCGMDVSANLLGMWERGERRIPVEYLDCICKALECTPNLLCPGFNAVPSDRIMQEFAALPDDEKEILEFAATQWDGNTHALIHFSNLYMALPRHWREDIAYIGLSIFEKACAKGDVDLSAPPVNLQYIEEQWQALKKVDKFH